jgi:hypothetical protein
MAWSLVQAVEGAHRAIKTALDRIAEHAPTLAEHLERNVRTGAF